MAASNTALEEILAELRHIKTHMPNGELKIMLEDMKEEFQKPEAINQTTVKNYKNRFVKIQKEFAGFSPNAFNAQVDINLPSIEKKVSHASAWDVSNLLSNVTKYYLP